jgi:hypothetical protein
MAFLPDIDPIDFLIARKFPEPPPTVLASLTAFPQSTPQRRRPPLSEQERRKRELEKAKYAEELHNMPADEFQALFEAETQKEHDEWRAKYEAEEKARFYNQPHASADFTHWSRAAHWTLDEAVALSFGKEPGIVHWEALEPFQRISGFVRQYARVRDLAQRAVVWEQLFDPVLPGIFIAWAQRNEIPFPQELEAAVKKRGNQGVNWKAKYDELFALYESHRDDWKKIAEEWKDHAERASAEREGLKEQLNSAARETPLGKRERESMLKMIAAMAIGGYGHDPTAGRSETVKQIVDDLQRQGVSLSDDTVRRYLTESIEHLNDSTA